MRNVGADGLLLLIQTEQRRYLANEFNGSHDGFSAAKSLQNFGLQEFGHAEGSKKEQQFLTLQKNIKAVAHHIIWATGKKKFRVGAPAGQSCSDFAPVLCNARAAPEYPWSSEFLKFLQWAAPFFSDPNWSLMIQDVFSPWFIKDCKLGKKKCFQNMSSNLWA